MPRHPKVLVDSLGVKLRDPATGAYVGVADSIAPFGGERLVVALATNQPGGLSGRYVPAKPAGERAVFALNYDAVLPRLAVIKSGTVQVRTNTATPADDGSWTVGAVTIRGRALYADLSGGKAGTDYLLTWTATDDANNVWPRTAACLVTATT